MKRPPSIILILGIVAAVVVMASLNRYMSGGESHHHHHDEDVAAQAPEETATPADKQEKPQKVSKDTVLIKTDKGDIKIKLFPEEMPVTVNNFASLIERKFYDGLKFHRVEDWVIQGGDPRGNGTGGSGKTIRLEINKKNGFNKAGMVGMARSQAPDSASSQFFIVKSKADWLNDGYACFGEVIEGLDVVKKIAVGDKMISVAFVSDGAAAPACCDKDHSHSHGDSEPDMPPPPPPAAN